MADDQFRCLWHWSNLVDAGRSFLRATGLAKLGAAARGLWTRLDHLVRIDGYCRVAGLARRRIAQRACSPVLVSGATGGERPVDMAIFCMEARRFGIRRYRAALVACHCNTGVFLADTPPGRRTSHSVCVVGRLCCGTQLFTVATQYARSGVKLALDYPKLLPLSTTSTMKTCSMGSILPRSLSMQFMSFKPPAWLWPWRSLRRWSRASAKTERSLQNFLMGDEPL